MIRDQMLVAECRIGHVTTDSRESGQSCCYSPAHGDDAKTNGHRVDGQQHPLYRGERPR